MAESLGLVCRYLPEVLAVAGETGDREELEEILAAARRGEAVDDRLRRLGLARHLESWPARGVPGTPPAGDQSGLVSMPGNAGGHVALGRYRCPAGACRRTERPRPGDGPPQCAIHRLPLAFDTL